jgi:hypothetical protein
MPYKFSSFLDELEARTRIEDALKRHARGVDRGDWALVESAYHPGGFEQHGGFVGQVEDFISYLKGRHKDVEHSVHFLGNVNITFHSATRAVVESYVLGSFLHPAGSPLASGEFGARMEALVRYVDDFTCAAGEWRILKRYVVMGDSKLTQLERAVKFPEPCIVQRHDTEDYVYKANAAAAAEVAGKPAR